MGGGLTSHAQRTDTEVFTDAQQRVLASLDRAQAEAIRHGTIHQGAPSAHSSITNKLPLAQRVVRKWFQKHSAKHVIECKRKTELKWVDETEIENDPVMLAKAHYLYWACFRGHLGLIKHFLEKDGITPFARIYEGRSPMMAAVYGKQRPVDNKMN